MTACVSRGGILLYHQTLRFLLLPLQLTGITWPANDGRVLRVGQTR